MYRVAVFEPSSRGPAPSPSVGSEGLRARLESLLASRQELPPVGLTWIEDEASLADDVSQADALLVLLPRVPRRTPGWVGELPPHLPLVVAVAGDPGAAALALRRVSVDDIVPLGEAGGGKDEQDGFLEDDPGALPDDGLLEALRRAASCGVTGRAAFLVRQLDCLSHLLCGWMLHVLEAVPPFGSMRDATRATGLTVSTLERHWRERIGRSSPGEFLRWVLLFRALRARCAGDSWRRVAEELPVHRRTLERTAKRLTGSTPEELAADGPRQMVERFGTYLHRTLVGE